MNPIEIDSNILLAEWKILDTVYKLSILTRPKILYSASSQYAETIYTNFHITQLFFQKFILHIKKQLPLSESCSFIKSIHYTLIF